jgi:hypothetical protein
MFGWVKIFVLGDKGLLSGLHQRQRAGVSAAHNRVKIKLQNQTSRSTSKSNFKINVNGSGRGRPLYTFAWV